MVEAAGSSVELVAAGQRVVIPTHLYCGLCYNCARGYSAACLRVRPRGFGAAYGYAGMGGYRGAQAQLLRVPFADANCMPVPGEPGDDREDDLVLLADAFVTGWHATELAEVTPGCTVAVFGAGAVGLLAAYSAVLKGASEIYVVDRVPERLERAGELGAVPVDFSAGDPVEQIRELRSRAGLPLGEENMSGFQAADRDSPDTERPDQVISDLARLVNPTGRIGIAGVYPAPRAGRQPRRLAAGGMGGALLQRGADRVRPDPRPPVHHHAARPGGVRARTPRPDHQPSRRPRCRAGTLRAVRPARRRGDQGGAHACLTWPGSRPP
ncbi:MAG: alcohol dehydrogenase catalytic domain-containing protein [Streptosporangiaceae bacterium]